MTLSEERVFDFPVIFMHGRNAFHLNDTERKRLKMYLERGGVLVADAICSSEEFANSVRQEIAAIFPEHPLERLPASDDIYTDKYGGFELKTLERREPQRQAPGGPLKAATRRGRGPKLEGGELGDHYAVLFSKYDLSCALERHDSLECPGYTRDDAARLGLNVVLYAACINRICSGRSGTSRGRVYFNCLFACKVSRGVMLSPKGGPAHHSGPCHSNEELSIMPADFCGGDFCGL